MYTVKSKQIETFWTDKFFPIIYQVSLYVLSVRSIIYMEVQNTVVI